ncbi:MAG: methyltransferase [Chlamydiae bacterium]|nr:methyltransferase [Chlamydiota bacterium]
MGCSARNATGFIYETYYQDVWVKGGAIIKGGRDCELRFWAIYEALKKAKKPLKVLDIGANMGYFSLRLLEKLPGTYVMIEGNESTAQALLKICKLNNKPSLVLFKRKLCLQDLRELRALEKFDVVIALSIVHHFKEPYQEVFETLMTLGRKLVFEPPIAEESTLNQERIIKEPLDLSMVNKKLLIKVPTGSRYAANMRRPTYLIECISNASYDTVQGVSPDTFRLMNGVYPSK